VIFSKKLWLRDLLGGVLDIHNHILPGIDDGAQTLEDSERMLVLYKEIGFSGSIPTPHTMVDYYGNDRDGILESYGLFKKQISDADFFKGVSSEYMMDSGFKPLMDDEKLLEFGESQILFELSYFQKPPFLEEYIFQMKTAGYYPILAHPERYRFMDLRELRELEKRGCRLQLNLLSLSGHYGKEEKKKAENLLSSESYSFVGTDAHRPEHLEKIQNIRISKKLVVYLRNLIELHNSLLSRVK